ncbi:pentatricopeptide repeat-containing protein [Carex littledalei]|uniref:Pentatricopeptide repeat-containing protein n=1 Tax=Carex littledalei TaxID=544730 RepID=A0A833RG65_9POAL|nr:pentatricopeptide repeat-containing protein [Carex littledalei]
MNRQILCLIGSMVCYCGNAGPNLFVLICQLVTQLNGTMTLLHAYAAVIRYFVGSCMHEDALLTYLEVKKVGVEINLCNFLLKALVDKEQLRFARGIFHDMMMCVPAPNVYTYSIMIDLYTSGDRLYMKEAYEILCEMMRKGIQPNAVTYSTYIHGLCRSGQVGPAWQFLKELCVRECLVTLIVSIE